MCWEVVRGSSVDPSSLVWVLVEACTNVRRLDNKAWSYVTSGLDVSLNQRVKYRVWVRVLTEGVPQVRLYTQRRRLECSVARGSLGGMCAGGLVVGVPPTRIVLSVDALTRAGLV